MGSLRFPARQLPSYAEPVEAGDLEVGVTYFFLNFLDDEMHIPCLEPMVFIGRDLEPGDRSQVYFQDAESYREGVRWQDSTGPARIYFGSASETGHVFHFEKALEGLLACSLRRSKLDR